MAGNGEPGPEDATRDGRPTRRSTGAVVVAAAALLGVALARLIDWRSHAHPR